MTIEAPITSDTFKKSMGLLAGGVCIVASSQDGERLGLTVTAVCSLTLDPPSLIVCVNRAAGAHEAIRTTKRVSVNFLAADQVELAELFSSSKIKGAERFQSGQWGAMASGSPAVMDGLAALDCEIVSDFSVGQHSVFVCEVKSAILSPEKCPLVHFNRKFFEVLPVSERCAA